jgi:hypothetical protein
MGRCPQSNLFWPLWLPQNRPRKRPVSGCKFECSGSFPKYAVIRPESWIHSSESSLKTSEPRGALQLTVLGCSFVPCPKEVVFGASCLFHAGVELKRQQTRRYGGEFMRRRVPEWVQRGLSQFCTMAGHRPSRPRPATVNHGSEPTTTRKRKKMRLEMRTRPERTMPTMYPVDRAACGLVNTSWCSASCG